MAQNVWLRPSEPMMIEGRKVIKILCEPNGQDKHNQRERKREMGKKNAKPIVCTSTGKTYDSIREASKEMDIKANAIGKVCRGEIKSTNGHTFKFKGDT